MKLQVNVTEEVIAQSLADLRADNSMLISCNCPVARAIKRVLPEGYTDYISVGGDSYSIVTHEGELVTRHNLPNSAIMFINKFDIRDRKNAKASDFEPVSFELEIEDER